jgi:hypothetical protein
MLTFPDLGSQAEVPTELAQRLRMSVEQDTLSGIDNKVNNFLRPPFQRVENARLFHSSRRVAKVQMRVFLVGRHGVGRFRVRIKFFPDLASKSLSSQGLAARISGLAP